MFSSNRILRNLTVPSFFVLIALSCVHSVHAQTIHLKTETYPPFNMNNEDEKIIGISTEIVETLFERSGVEYTMELLPWQRAFNMALEEQNTAVFSTTRTAEREPKFKWVGPLVQNNWVFLARERNDIEISSLDDAKGLKVGGYQGDAVALFLADQGFDLDLTPHDSLNARKLARDRIDLWATGHLLGPYQASLEGLSGFEPVFTFRETIMAIAMNINTPDEIVDRLNSELQAMRASGVIAEIEARYQ
ncbi:MAG: ABC transporter substrate-binding protein [Pseudomonadota bacterium]